MIKAHPSDIYVGKLKKPLHQIGVNGINGTLYDSNGSVMILVNKGEIIGPNANFNGWNRPKRPVIYFTAQGNLLYKEVKSVYDLDYDIKDIAWAVGGGRLPFKASEEWGADVLRRAERTGLAIKDGLVYLIATKEKLTLEEFGSKIEKTISPDHAIFLDGGGSTQMYYYDEKIKSTRPVDNGVFIK